MASANKRVLAHQLSNGLFVSGRPESHKDVKAPTMSSTAVPYTGGDIRKSGELGKMFDIPLDNNNNNNNKLNRNSGSFKKSVSQSGNTGNVAAQQGGTSKSGNLHRQASAKTQSRSSGDAKPLSSAKNSGSQQQQGHGHGQTSSAVPSVSRTNSGNLLPATGLITSGPLPSSSKKVISGPLDHSGSPFKVININLNPAINNLSNQDDYSFHRGFPKIILWTLIPLFIIGFVVAAFILVTVHNVILLIVVGFLCLFICLLWIWNVCRGKRALLDFMDSQSDADLTCAENGEYVKVTGVVTCGSVPLETSYQKINRCIYASSGLYEYRGLNAKPARVGHHLFSWGLQYAERHVADFYISDFQSGLRALVKAGSGSRVIPCVKDTIITEVGPKSKEMPYDFVRWLKERNLAGNDPLLRLKEGYIKEGSTVTVMGMVQRQENVLTIVPPREKVSTGCQWCKFLLPGAVEGLLLACNDSSKFDGIPL